MSSSSLTASEDPGRKKENICVSTRSLCYLISEQLVHFLRVWCTIKHGSTLSVNYIWIGTMLQQRSDHRSPSRLLSQHCDMERGLTFLCHGIDVRTVF